MGEELMETTENAKTEAITVREEQEVKPVTDSSVITKPIPKDKGINRFWYLFLILGLLGLIGVGYLWSSNQQLFRQVKTIETLVSPTESPFIETEDPALVKLGRQSSSDEIGVIEKDLTDTDLANLDQELTEIERELSVP